MFKLLRRNESIRQSLRNIKMIYIRRRKGLKYASKTFYCNSNTILSKDLRAGEYSFINYGCDVCSRVSIGNYTMLGPHVLITGDDHVFEEVGVPIYFAGRPELRPTVIEDDVWIGARSIIMAGVTVKRGAIVAAGSVVTKDVGPYDIVGGVPARKIRDRFNSAQQKTHSDMLNRKPRKLWNYPAPR